MPLKIWEIPLEDGFRILCRRETLLGRWVDFAVVLLRDDECITRYDAAHGFPHRDVLGRSSGLIRKQKCSNMTFKEAFAHGLDDIRTHYKTHYEFFCRYCAERHRLGRLHAGSRRAFVVSRGGSRLGALVPPSRSFVPANFAIFWLSDVSSIPVAKIEAVQMQGSIQKRAQRVNWKRVDEILARVPDVPPMPGDELP